MDAQGSWLDLFIVVLALAGAVLYLYARSSRRAALVARLKSEVERKGRQNSGGSRSWFFGRNWRAGMARFLRRIGGAIPLFSAAQRIEVAQKLVAAGFRSAQALMIMAALSLLSALAMLSAAIVLGWPHFGDHLVYKLGSALAALYVGTLLPRLVLDRLVVHRQRAIARSLPDALDLLVICTNSGLGLNSAIHRVAEELEHVAPELSDELRLTSSELQLSSDVPTVLERLAERTRLPAMRSLVGTLVQSRQYGTAITQALRVLARTERTARMMRLEEAAAKLSVKITMPMMLFILPTVLIVAAGPAILSLMDVFSGK
ncbi:type II secretion system F family protein [Pusillimonas sp.]|uniref:type II secretion system F family protein n=1 Tax=Pusillimonas sp. TaxID=3040095 RepID=UPI0037C50E86